MINFISHFKIEMVYADNHPKYLIESLNFFIQYLNKQNSLKFKV